MESNSRNWIRAALAVLAAVLSFAELSVAQTTQKILRVGASWVAPSNQLYAVTTASFLKRMDELGYKSGQGYAFEYVNISQHTQEEYDAAYRELAARNVDIFVSIGLERPLKSAVAAAGTKPIVMIAINWDPVARGYISSMARPGGNITGLTFQDVELTTKRFQMMMEVLPGLKAATVFWDEASADHWREAETAAAKLGLRVRGVRFEGLPPYDFERAWTAVTPEYRGGLIILGSPYFTLPERRTLPDFALRHRIPTMFVIRQQVDHGGLASYGPNYPTMIARAADYVDRIAKGAKPADLPVEQPTKFEFVVNLKTASALGLEVSQTLLTRADEVVE